MTAPGKLFGVGVGPGDPELMTLKAARALANADVIAHFAKAGRASHSRVTAAPYLRADVAESPAAEKILERLALPETARPVATPSALAPVPARPAVNEQRLETLTKVSEPTLSAKPAPAAKEEPADLSKADEKLSSLLGDKK